MSQGLLLAIATAAQLSLAADAMDRCDIAGHIHRALHRYLVVSTDEFLPRLALDAEEIDFAPERPPPGRRLPQGPEQR